MGFNLSNGVTGGSDSTQLIIETNATRFTSGFVSAFNTGSATITGFARLWTRNGLARLRQTHPALHGEARLQLQKLCDRWVRLCVAPRTSERRQEHF
jgi:hypothetical protein